MSYPTETLLVRKEPLEDVEIEIGLNKTGKMMTRKVTHPLNKLRVLTPSPISATTASIEEWNGIGGEALVVEPLGSFGANEVAPVAVLNRDYSVERLGPEDEGPVLVDRQALIKKQQQMRSPEDVFAQAAFDQQALETQEASDAASAAEKS